MYTTYCSPHCITAGKTPILKLSAGAASSLLRGPSSRLESPGQPESAFLPHPHGQGPRGQLHGAAADGAGVVVTRLLLPVLRNSQNAGVGQEPEKERERESETRSTK